MDGEPGLGVAEIETTHLTDALQSVSKGVAVDSEPIRRTTHRRSSLQIRLSRLEQLPIAIRLDQPADPGITKCRGALSLLVTGYQTGEQPSDGTGMRIHRNDQPIAERSGFRGGSETQKIRYSACDLRGIVHWRSRDGT